MKTKKIFIAGHRGLVGSALMRRYHQDASREIVVRTRQELDLTDRKAVDDFMQQEKPAEVIVAAARVGGIKANSDFPVEFLLDNLRVQDSVLSASHRAGVEKLLFLGSSCIYPKLAPQPIREESLLTGPLEPTNEPYAVAKIAGIRLAQAYAREYGCNFISAMPTNLYGPNDNFALESSHVLPAMLRKFHDAKMAKRDSVLLWGSGSPRREFMHVDDLADACHHLMANYNDPDIINIGSGDEVTIAELAQLVAKTVGFAGEVLWDATKPDGSPRKRIDSARIHALGWKRKTPLEEGMRSTYQWFLENTDKRS